ncbi:MAG: type II toxin-antitoxin system VapC family toxin [Sulfuritalea sp.]|jgi:ribonuclease VapC|nr:type II toxin-antitoxin system VapC family toxin [Sulfuritalea sp.]
MASPVDAVVDTSALVAILLRESDATVYLDALAQIPRWGIAAPNRTELLMVASVRLLGDGAAYARELLARYQIRTLPADEVLADAAADAFQRYGKGRHAASLNFGDCFAYALARQYDVPLLFKGGDFGLTDVSRAI